MYEKRTDVPQYTYRLLDINTGPLMVEEDSGTFSQSLARDTKFLLFLDWFSKSSHQRSEAPLMG